MQKKILLISPHPDDEILCCAGLLQYLLSQKYEIFIVIVTDGCACFDYSRSNPVSKNDIITMRKKESLNAGEFLNISKQNYIWLNFPDNNLKYGISKFRQKVSSLISGLSPELIISPSELDRHDDHNIIGKVIKDLSPRTPKLFYLMWGANKFNPSYQFTYKLNHSEIKKKIKLLDFFKSQFSDFNGEIEPILNRNQIIDEKCIVELFEKSGNLPFK